MRMLVAVDLSPASEPLMRHAARLAARIGAEVAVVHVFAPEDAASARPEAGLHVDQFIEQLRGEVKYLLVQSRLAWSTPRVEIVAGHPVEAILSIAARDAVDLIVLGTHGRTGLGRLLLGSVAEGVLRRTLCPVVVVPHAILIGATLDHPTQARV